MEKVFTGPNVPVSKPKEVDYPVFCASGNGVFKGNFKEQEQTNTQPTIPAIRNEILQLLVDCLDQLGRIEDQDAEIKKVIRSARKVLAKTS